MAQQTRHGLYGGPRMLYGSFAGKTEFVAADRVYSSAGELVLSHAGPRLTSLSHAGPEIETLGHEGPSLRNIGGAS